jgi:class 3 adenylate cyclase
MNIDDKNNNNQEIEKNNINGNNIENNNNNDENLNKDLLKSNHSFHKSENSLSSNSNIKNINENNNNYNNNNNNINIKNNITTNNNNSNKISLSKSLLKTKSMVKAKKRPIWKKKICKFLDSTFFLIFTSLLTIFALFASDLQLAFLRIEVDNAFNICQCIIFGVFLLEFILNCIAKNDYLFSFFFFLDLIATISLVQDIDWIINPVLGYSSNMATASRRKSVQASKAMSKVSSASRATRILRIVRVVRLIRMVKLYKNYLNKKGQIQAEKEINKNQGNSNKSNGNGKNESSYSTKASNFSTNHKNSSLNNSIKDDENKKNSPSSSVNLKSENERKNSNDKLYLHDNQLTIKNNENKNNLVNGGGNNNSKTNHNTENNNKKLKPIRHKENTRNGGNTYHESNLKTDTNLLENKLEKNDKTNISKKIDKNLSSTMDVIDLEDEEKEILKESRIAQVITESLTQKVIILVMILLIIFPLLSDDFYIDDSQTIVYTFIAQYISATIDLFSYSSLQVSESIIVSLLDQNFPLLNVTYNGTVLFSNSNYTNNYFRYKEVQSVFSDDGYVQFVYSLLKETKLQGILNIAQTVFVCIMLTGAALLFEYDARTLVLEPLEVMIEIVEKVSNDPMNAKNVDELQSGIKAKLDQLHRTETLQELGNNNMELYDESYEVQVIKSAIIKICALLAIGFGDAGGEIIKTNITSGKDLNPRLSGKKKTCIFGFCDIRQFEEINLALEEKTIILINEIAEIVHSSVDRFGGSTNKNIGESFLNVWKFYDEKTVIDAQGKVTLERKDNLLEKDPTNPNVALTADQSILSVLRILKKINKSANILSYRENKEILKRIPDFKLNMGFGLHVGYGIEGAVGSTYKIDASYLSPNVNIAARLETATRQFGLSLLISGPLYDLLSDDMKSICRFVDCVMVKGSVLPLELYTIDVNLNFKNITSRDIVVYSQAEKRKYYNDKKEIYKKEVEVTKNATKIVLEKDSYLELLTTKKKEQFYELWDDGIDYYKSGDFKNAGKLFKKCLELDPTDGPVKTLLNYFDKCKYITPKNWKGVRELTSK